MKIIATVTNETPKDPILGNLKEAALQRQRELSHDALRGEITPTSKSDTQLPNSNDYEKAIQDVYNIQERVGFTFIMLGDLAKAIKDKSNVFNGKKIEIGMPIRYLTPEVKSVFKTWKFEETPFGYQYFYTPEIRWHIKIPIEIHVYKKHWPFFDNLDFGFFGTEMLHIPNPFDKYWKVRNLIK